MFTYINTGLNGWRLASATAGWLPALASIISIMAAVIKQRSLEPLTAKSEHIDELKALSNLFAAGKVEPHGRGFIFTDQFFAEQKLLDKLYKLHEASKQETEASSPTKPGGDVELGDVKKSVA